MAHAHASPSLHTRAGMPDAWSGLVRSGVRAVQQAHTVVMLGAYELTRRTWLWQGVATAAALRRAQQPWRVAAQRVISRSRRER